MAEHFSEKNDSENITLLKAQSPGEEKHPVKYSVRLALAVLMAFTVTFAAITIYGDLPVVKGKEAENPASGIQYDRGTPPPERPVFPTANDDTFPLGDECDSKHIIVIDCEKYTIVAAKDPLSRAYPASTTKIMTLLVAAEQIKDITDTFTITLEITDRMYKENASVADFAAGERVSLHDLLYGMILPSGADAAVGLAESLAGSEAAFVKLMNKKVKELGLTDTHFANVTGLFDSENYSTARDIAVILKAAMESPLCREILSTYQHTTAATPEHPEGILLTSTLFSYMYGTEPKTAEILGGKTGYLDESGYCIASFGQNTDTGKEYIVVSLGGSGRWPAFYGQIDLYSAFAK